MHLKCGKDDSAAKCEHGLDGSFERKSEDFFSEDELGACKNFVCPTRELELKIRNGGTDAWKCKDVR